jgi:deoxyadenosine/deoxycytidine kinase
MRVAIEANIGAGKSSLLRRLAQILPSDFTVAEEPVHDFTLLRRFYEDPKKWLLPMQAQVIGAYKAAYRYRPPQTLVQERSPFASMHVFSKIGIDDLPMNQEEKQDLYWSMCEALLDIQDEPDYIVYLNAKPKTCFDRIRERGRLCEQGVSLEYLQKIDEAYHQYLHFEHDMAAVPEGAYIGNSALYHDVVDAEQHPEDVLEEVMELLRKGQNSEELIFKPDRDFWAGPRVEASKPAPAVYF